MEAGRGVATTRDGPARRLRSTTCSCNGNFFVPTLEGVSVAHEADPVLNGQYMLVTDERGGGVVPPSSSCLPSLDNPIGNGGAHVFDLRNPSKPEYALTPDGDPAVFVGQADRARPTFCDIHVIEPIPGESRFLAAYYSQGTKIVDFFVDENRRWVSSRRWPRSRSRTRTRGRSTNFLNRANADGTRTYFFMASDIERGIDVFSWTGPANPLANPRPIAAPPRPGRAADVALLAVGLVGVPAAAIVRRRRRPGSA